MILHVLDASVAAKWFLPRGEEQFIPEALALLRQFQSGEVKLLVPELFWIELANILWKAVRKRRLRQLDADAAVRELLGDEEIETFSSKDLVIDALEVASRKGLSLYDSVYIALAAKTGCVFVTADERLVRAVGPDLPVKWLGDL